jgi:hypothetical protein
MQPFPDRNELQFLIGLRISNVILQPYSIDFTFEDNSFLVVEHCLVHKFSEADFDTFDIQNGYISNRLHSVVSKKIVGIKAETWALSLCLKDGQVLQIVSNPGPLESGHFSRHGKVLVF